MDATGSRRPWPCDETPIEDLNLWTRALNALRREGVRTVGGLRRKTDADLLRLRGFGPGALAAVRTVVPPRHPVRPRQAARYPTARAGRAGPLHRNGLVLRREGLHVLPVP